MATSQIQILDEQNSTYPSLLKEISDPPKALHVLGSLPPTDTPWITVVGSRRISAYGRLATKKIVTELVGYGCVIVSGLALGLDSVAHAAALDARGTTIAVLPSGIRRIYPASHAGLAKRILQNGGALISEYGDDRAPQKFSFTERNRIVAGMSQAVVVVEAAQRSGTLITARLGLEQNREICAVPGPINSPTSEGANMLIQSGAHAVTSGEDIIRAIGYEPTILEVKAYIPANETEQSILQHLKDEMHIDELMQATGIQNALLTSTLTMLEIQGVIASTYTGVYIRK